MANRPVRHRSFTPSSDQPVIPLSFELYEETFQCRPRLQGSVILDFVARADDDGAAGAANFVDFFDKALLPESRDRFHALIESEDKIVEIETLGSVLAWLVEEYTSRPTPAS